MALRMRSSSLISRSGVFREPQLGLNQRNARVRVFHATHPRSFSLDVCCGYTHNVITSIHHFSGLPWVLSLPLTALAVRTFLVTPLSAYSHKATQRQLDVQPLLQAWKHVIRNQVMRDFGSKGPVTCEKIIKKRTRSKISAIAGRHGAGLWKRFVPLLGLPVWLVVIETIRKMCGTYQGLLGLLGNTIQNGAIFEEFPEILDSTSATISVEDSFATEGALWFPNLLVPDPMLILPFVLSGSMFASIYLQQLLHQGPGTRRTKFQTRLTNILKILALAIGPGTLNVPSAMLLYWISSVWFAMGQNFLQDRMFPLISPTTIVKPASDARTERLRKVP